MKYVVHHRYKGPAADGTPLNIPYGTQFDTIGDFIATPEGKGICFVNSEVAKRHFAPNDDGRGLERGALTYAIAFSRRNGGDGARFSDGEAEMLLRSWGRWLRQDVDTILFNEDFFGADPAELRELAKALNIKIRRQRICMQS